MCVDIGESYGKMGRPRREDDARAQINFDLRVDKSILV
jgi:hypothetical protein